MPSGIVADDLLLAVFTHGDSSVVGTSTPSAGWTQLGTEETNTETRQSLFYKVAAGSDTLTVTTANSEESSHIVLLIKNGGTPTATSASSTSTNANPPSHNAGSSAKYLWITTGGWDNDGTNSLDISAPPAGYSDYIYQPRSNRDVGAVTAVSNRYAEIQTEDPGTWTSAIESWVSFTIAVPFLASAATTATGSGFTGTTEN
jgi:hypothetical protein